MEGERRASAERERDLQLRNTTLEAQLSQLTAEMNDVIQQLQQLTDTKLGLELEITAYRKLLDADQHQYQRRTLTSVLHTYAMFYKVSK